MPTITQQINEIIDRRLGRGKWANNGRLQQIEKAEERLALIGKQVAALQDLLQLIEYQRENKNGEYYALLQKNPQIEEKLKLVSTENVRNCINNLQAELRLLKKRFSRETVQIAMIGRERMGKSTLIQSITGLGNEVIPAFDGKSCTGTVSVIHNSDGQFHADISFFERSEFIDNINLKLGEFFPGENLRVGTLEDIPGLLGVLGERTLNTDAKAFFDSFVRHYDDYHSLIGHAPISLTERAIVAQYVAQYQLFDSREQCPKGYEIIQNAPDEHGKIKYSALYFKYLAVKTVNIYTPFEYPDSGKLVLVDTIGIGQATNNVKLLEEMYRVIREESDSAIDLFRPDSMGPTLGDTQVDILKGVKMRFDERNPEKWFTYVINEVTKQKGFNANNTQNILNDAIQLQKSGDISFAWAKVINCSNTQEVIDKLVIPQLNLITANIDSIDSDMMVSAQKLASTLFYEYTILCNNANAVLSSSIKTNQKTIHLFDSLYKDLPLSSVIRELDNKKFDEQERPCTEIESKLSEITEEQLYDLLPDQSSIAREVSQGVKSAPVIFAEAINEFRNHIFDVYERVNIDNLRPLQDEVKMQMVELFYNEGLLKNIPLASYDVREGPSIAWLSALLTETVDADQYPQVYSAFKLIIDYQISIEGLIEYNVANSVHLINPMYPEFFQIPFTPLPTNDVKAQADHIYQELFNRITHIQENLRSWITDFSMIPSHSFYARVHKVREKLFLSPEGNEQLRYYYLDNCSSIWSKEIRDLGQIENAFGSWNAMSNDLNGFLNKQYFEF